MVQSNIGNTVVGGGIDIDHKFDLSYTGQINGGNINNPNKPNLSYMIQSSTGNTVIDNSVNTISDFAQRVNDELQKKSEPVILIVERGSEENFASFNTSANCAKIGAAIIEENPNIYVKWWDVDGMFMSPVSINTDYGNTIVTVWGWPFIDSNVSDNIIGVQYYSSNIVDANHLFDSYRIIRATINNYTEL